METLQTNHPFEFDYLYDGLLELDLKNKMVRISSNASKLIGYNDMLHLKCNDLLNMVVHGGHKFKIRKKIRQMAVNKTDFLDSEVMVKTSVNNLKWIQLRCKTVSRDINGNPVRVIGSINDISKHKIAQEEKRILRSIIDNLPVAIYVMDKMGRKLLANKTDCAIMGADNQLCVLGKTDLKLYPGNTGKRLHNDNMNVIKNEQPVVNQEESYFDKKGKQKWLLTNKLPLYTNNKQVFGVVGIGIDITEQKMLQKKITESEMFYRTLINLSPDAILIHDLEGRITFASKSVYKVFLTPEGETYTGKSIYDLLVQESIGTAMANFRELVSNKRPPNPEEYKCKKYDKSTFWAELTSSVLTDEAGNITGVMIVGRDITGRKKVEEELVYAKNKAEENDRLKTAFLQNISHEIRTPLNAIVGFSSLLDDNCLTNEQQKQYVDTIIKSSYHLLEIINDIIEISKIESGIITLNEKELDLNKLIEDLYNQFKLDSQQKRINLHRSVGLLHEKVVIKSDGTKLFQIMSNLLSNALKFTDSGTVRFGYSLEGDNLRFFVSDTGIGIPESHFCNIFKRFYQVKHPVNRLYEGTGLGLAICKAYVDLMGGRIWLTSKLGEGTTFYFTVPFKQDKSLMKKV